MPQKPARGARRAPSAPQHPGEVLAAILADTPPALAAKWFALDEASLGKVLAGAAPLTPEMAATAGTIFGTGAAPWIEMQSAWDEWQAAEAARRAAKAAK
ncbi:hypothetical protein [Sutterella sp.]|uniref:helix-turn-helix transcriptional regulator n=1 Tax=Sutterella sp. TaxID=1981025 RepID=UPI0026DF8AEB|nr:hypothetical protein [Sutterella sp.]MDO5531191.1 hypothetical protein [Sutterella sp.]